MSPAASVRSAVPVRLEQLPPAVFEIPVRVYYEDTDAGGIVYHANYLRFFERARTDWLRSLGAIHSRIAHESDAVFVVRDMTIDFQVPARLDDLLSVDVRVLQVRRATLQLAQVARRHETGETLVTSTMRIAAIDRRSARPVGLPRWLVERIAPPA